MSTYTPTPRTTVRRLKKRAVYDKSAIHAILDDGFLCHLGFAVGAQPFVIPTLYVRHGERLYLHGSGASRMLRTLQEGLEVCATVTHVDGLVLARSAFHHSVNYRSVVVMGRARWLTEQAERAAAMRLLTDRIVPHRWEEVREPNELEWKQTAVLALSIGEASAKIRTGPPLDDEEDYARPVWAGVIPMKTQLGEPIPDGRVSPSAPALNLERFRKSPYVAS